MNGNGVRDTIVNDLEENSSCRTVEKFLKGHLEFDEQEVMKMLEVVYWTGRRDGATLP